VTETSAPRARAALAVGQVCLAASCWGIAASIAKFGFDRGVPPTAMAQARVLIAAILLGALLAWRNPALLRAPRASWPLLAVYGCALALVNITYYVAIDRVPVGVAISIQYTAPALVLGWTVLVARRRARRLAWFAVALTLTGAVLVSQALAGFQALDPVGLAGGAGAALSLATVLLFGETFGRRGLPASTTVFWGFAGAVAFWSVAAPWWRWPVRVAVEAPAVALAVVGVGIVGTLIPFLLEVGALRVLPASTVGIALTTEPLFAAGFAWVLLGQSLGRSQLAGGALVVAGVVLAHLSTTARRAAPAAAGPEPAILAQRE
jgi:drug/metabolite transporter (DMT)-like permease